LKFSHRPASHGVPVLVSANYPMQFPSIDLNVGAPLFGSPRDLRKQFLAKVQHCNHAARLPLKSGGLLTLTSRFSPRIEPRGVVRLIARGASPTDNELGTELAVIFGFDFIVHDHHASE
jgi:hypothetical protein